MTRIATYGQSQILLTDVLRNEQRVFDGQRAVTSGIREKDYKGFSIDVTTIAGAKNLKKAAESFQHDNDQVMRRLDLYDINLSAMRDIAQGLRDDVLAAINGNTGVALRQKIDDYCTSAVSLFDTRDNGRYIFSGSFTDNSPLQSTANTPAGVAAVTADVTTNPANVFANNDVKAQARLDDALSMTYGVVADDVGDELFEAFRRLMRFDDNTELFGFATGGPIGQPMTEDQRNFLMGEIDRLNSAIDDINEAQATNGVHQRTVEDTQARLGDNVTFITIFIADIEEADMGVAVSRLQQDQLALDASFRMLGQLARISLLDFI
jgi:flagellar hook-associated protein 3 FlgL